MVTRKGSGKASSMAGGLALGAGISMGITLLTSVIAAKLVDAGSLKENGIGYAAMVILLLSSIVGSAIPCARIKRQRMAVCLISGGIYYLMLLSLTALFFGGQYYGMGVTALVIAGGCGCVFLAGTGKGCRPKRGIKRPVPR